MLALHGRGHEIRQVLQPTPAGEVVRAEVVAGCDALLVYRRHEPNVLEIARKAKERGMALIYDNDDDMTAVPRDDEAYKDYGGLAGDRARGQIRKLLQQADLVTTPSAVIAERYREMGATNVQVIENYVPDTTLRASAPANRDVVFGWLAGNEHHLDLRRVPIRDAVGRLLDAHEHVRMRMIGVSLELRHERYEHVPHVDFFDLPPALAEFDVGIAVLADLQLNHARSNIKVKEYAALGKPWLASAIGPYVPLGEKQGGRLVANDRWYEEMERLLLKPRDRKKLARRARAWGRSQAISENVGLWEDALKGALARARSG
jgi:glycosyltransferase involved in cell wall biosynthesis